MSSPESSSENHWPGERLGLPDAGPRSVGRVGRRIVALGIDWIVAYVISIAFFRTTVDADLADAIGSLAILFSTDGFITLAIFAVLQYLFQIVTNGSLGHLIMGMRVVPVSGGYLGFWRPLVRTLLLCLAIPALIWDVDQRGLHDKAAGTVLVRV